jgi:hypothetical protein
MYLPKNKYKIKNTTGNEIQTSNGSPYVGSYIETSRGTIYQGSDLKGSKPKLFKIVQDTSIGIDRPYNDYYGPSVDDYKNGSYIRYFTQDKRSKKITEMNLEQWLEKSKLKYINPGQLTWLLLGPVEDGKYNGISYKGTSTKNKETVYKLEKDYPGIKRFFSDTSEFVR